MEEYKNLLNLGIEKINFGYFQEALELINKSIQIKNDWDISSFYRGVVNHALQNLDDAILDYTKAIKINPKMTDAYYNRAKIILEDKKYSKLINCAIDDLNKALELDSNFVDALYAMAAAQKRLENYNKSLEYLERLLKIQPEAVHARALKKLLLQKYIK